MASLRDILIICPQFMGALLPNAFATFLHRKEVALWMMSCGALILSQESYTQLADDIQQQVTDFLVFVGAESTHSLSDSMSQI